MTQVEIMKLISKKAKTIREAKERIAKLQEEIDSFAIALQESHSNNDNCFSLHGNLEQQIIQRKQSQLQLQNLIEASKKEITELNAQLQELKIQEQQNEQSNEPENN